MDNFVTARFPLPLFEENPRGAAVAEDQTASSTDPSDEVLISRVCEGDKEALAFLFRRYARMVRGVACRVLRDASEADDLLQDIFLLIHRLCKTFDGTKAPARFWILQMTYRRAISRRRYLTSRHFYTHVDFDEAVESGTKSGSYDDPIDRMIGQETLQEIFKDLSEDQQKTLRLFFFDGYNFEEIAAALGQTAGNVSHHYYRGLEKLRRQMPALGGKLQAKRAL